MPVFDSSPDWRIRRRLDPVADLIGRRRRQRRRNRRFLRQRNSSLPRHQPPARHLRCSRPGVRPSRKPAVNSAPSGWSTRQAREPDARRNRRFAEALQDSSRMREEQDRKDEVRDQEVHQQEQGHCSQGLSEGRVLLKSINHRHFYNRERSPLACSRMQMARP